MSPLTFTPTGKLHFHPFFKRQIKTADKLLLFHCIQTVTKVVACDLKMLQH